MRISDWSSDVCSSDLRGAILQLQWLRVFDDSYRPVAAKHGVLAEQLHRVERSPHAPDRVAALVHHLTADPSDRYCSTRCDVDDRAVAFDPPLDRKRVV